MDDRFSPDSGVRKRARTTGGIPASRTAHDRDDEIAPTDELSRGIFVAGAGGMWYSWLVTAEARTQVVKKPCFTTFLLLLAAAICQVEIFILEFMTRYD